MTRLAACRTAPDPLLPHLAVKELPQFGIQCLALSDQLLRMSDLLVNVQGATFRPEESPKYGIETKTASLK